MTLAELFTEINGFIADYPIIAVAVSASVVLGLVSYFARKLVRIGR